MGGGRREEEAGSRREQKFKSRQMKLYFINLNSNGNFTVTTVEKMHFVKGIMLV
jgi:hypothetical protein